MYTKIHLVHYSHRLFGFAVLISKLEALQSEQVCIHISHLSPLIKMFTKDFCFKRSLKSSMRVSSNNDSVKTCDAASPFHLQKMDDKP